MLFEIDHSVAELFSTGAHTSADTEAVAMLALSAAEGKHRIAGPRSVLRVLAGLTTLRSRERAAFQRALAQTAEAGQLARHLQTVGCVVAQAAARPVMSATSGRTTITFPLTWFNETARIQPAVLLCENPIDVRIMRLI